MYDKMEEPDDDENDMLDLAFGLTETSRLGCQIKMSKEIDGLRVKLPSMTRNLQASDFKGKSWVVSLRHLCTPVQTSRSSVFESQHLPRQASGFLDFLLVLTVD
jgi:hypothetical protein